MNELTVSAVVPVYQGEKTLEALVAELLPLTALSVERARVGSRRRDRSIACRD